MSLDGASDHSKVLSKCPGHQVEMGLLWYPSQAGGKTVLSVGTVGRGEPIHGTGKWTAFGGM